MTIPRIDIDERLSHAATLSSEWYREPPLLQVELKKVLARTWQLVGRVEQVAKPGHFFTTTIGQEPVLVVRGNDDKLRAMSNVCRHRAGPVATGTGHCGVFHCGYHGWSYAHNGRLIGTPEFDGVADFQKRDVCLPRFQVAQWAGLVFVNCDLTAPSLEDILDDIPERVAKFDFGTMKFAARKDWEIDCNWKTYVDNYLEGYHIPTVHPSLNRELDYNHYRTETKRYYSIQHSPVKNPQRIRLNENDANNEALYFWVFPNLMLNVYPDNYSTNLIVPLGPERTLTIFEWYFHNPEAPEVQEKVKQTIEFSDEVQIEDIAICEAVQRGLRSQTYQQGRFSVKRENGVHHFHRLLAEFLAS